jgi:hypothetical protein
MSLAICTLLVLNVITFCLNITTFVHPNPTTTRNLLCAATIDKLRLVETNVPNRYALLWDTDGSLLANEEVERLVFESLPTCDRELFEYLSDRGRTTRIAEAYRYHGRSLESSSSPPSSPPPPSPQRAATYAAP